MCDEVQKKNDPVYEDFINALVEYGARIIRKFSMLNTQTQKVHHIVELEHIDALKESQSRSYINPINPSLNLPAEASAIGWAFTLIPSSLI